jgi:hypothetical protein
MTRAQAQPRAQVVPVSGYRLVVPDGWFAIDLDPAWRERAVAALARRQFAGLDNAPHLRVQARDDLLTRAADAYAAGGLEMFLSLEQIAGIPLPASLVIFAVPPPEGSQQTAASLAAVLGGSGRQVTVVDLPAGRSVRSVQRDGPDGTSHSDAASCSLEVFVPVPGGGGWLLLSFATPFGPLAVAMTRLFDAICTTLRWEQ